ncbi:salicylate carboxymethyltransferase-like protein [Tanacetum coccineum]
MADLGCSSGPNTLLVGSMVIDAVAKTSLEMGLLAPEVQINLNDLPTNDFNTIFSALHDFQENTTTEEIIDDHHLSTCYFSGVPGSFFSRLFPANTLHFVHSSYSLQWLSQLPELEQINKGHIYLSITTPECVSKAYYQQFRKDFLGFLMCRAEEMMDGGRMVLTLAGRTTDDARGSFPASVVKLQTQLLPLELAKEKGVGIASLTNAIGVGAILVKEGCDGASNIGIKRELMPRRWGLMGKSMKVPF